MATAAGFEAPAHCATAEMPIPAPPPRGEVDPFCLAKSLPRARRWRRAAS